MPESLFHLSGYKVVHWRNNDRGRVFVKDRHGRTVVDASDYNVTPEKMGDLDGDGHADLLLTSWSGGAHASFGYYLIGLGSRSKCLLAYWKGNGEGTKEEDLRLEDLDGDGKPEIISWYDGFAYRLGAGYAPLRLPLLMKWEGDRYIEATAQYPERVRILAHASLDRLVATKRRSDRIEIESRVAAVEFLSIKMLLGEEVNGWRVVLQHVAPSVYRSLRGQRFWIRRVVEDRKLRVRHPSLGRIPLKWNDLHSGGSDGGYE